jgi:hypothetical protein
MATRVCLGTLQAANTNLHRHIQQERKPAKAKRAPLEGGNDRERTTHKTMG